MQTTRSIRINRILGVLLFSLGVLLATAFFTGATWSDFESTFFDPALGRGQPLDSMKCPLVIGRGETGVVNTTLRNETDQIQRRFIRAHISDGYLTAMREISTRVEIEPGESHELEWEVFPEDAVWKRVILVRAYLFGNYPLPSEAATCGILVLSFLNLTGGQIAWLHMIASLVLLAAGFWLWIRSNRPLQGKALSATYAMGVIGLLVLAGIVSAWIGNWMMGAVTLVLTILLIVVVGAHFIQISES